jgi:dihydrolipoamide dehydrogenase
LHIAKVITDAEETAHQGVLTSQASRWISCAAGGFRDRQTDQGAGNAGETAQGNQDQGTGTFTSSNMIRVKHGGNKNRVVRTRIIAAGSKGARIRLSYDESRLMVQLGRWSWKTCRSACLYRRRYYRLEMATVYDASATASAWWN